LLNFGIQVGCIKLALLFEEIELLFWRICFVTDAQVQLLFLTLVAVNDSSLIRLLFITCIELIVLHFTDKFVTTFDYVDGRLCLISLCSLFFSAQSFGSSLFFRSGSPSTRGFFTDYNLVIVFICLVIAWVL
jgi:hypothetical protein